jgi:4'-phosphopantetheinyl transferase
MKAMAVHVWPGPTPAPQDGLFAILLTTSAGTLGDGAPSQSGIAPSQSAPAPASGDALPSLSGAVPSLGDAAPSQSDAGPGAGVLREAARRRIRLAAREALSAVLRIPVGDVSITSRPGEAPSILLAGRPSAIGISFTHDDIHSLAAINLQGPIGADIMRVQDIPDWQAVARDYLGPATAARLQALPASERPRAFALAWTANEARLKLEARHLTEWQPSATTAQTQSLILPAGMAGTLATRL